MMRSFPYELTGPPVVVRPDAQTLRRSVLAFEPVVFKNVLDDWPVLRAVQNATDVAAKMAVLAPYLGDRQVRFTVTPAREGGHLGFAADLRARNAPMHCASLQEFAQHLEQSASSSDRDVIYMQSRTVEWGTELTAALRGFARLSSLERGRANLWIGSGGQIVNLHYDDKLNFMCVLEGVKRVVLLPPSASANLYPGPLDSCVGAPASYVRLLDPDWVRFPRFSQALAQARLVTLSAGDVFCMPPFWWHHVESFGFNIMLNGWFCSGPPDAEQQIKQALRNGAVLFEACSSEERQGCRAIYLEGLFEPQLEESALSKRLTTLSPEHQAHFQSCHQALARLPEYWRREIRHLFDYYVFQTNGEPMAAVPGEFARMLERFSGAGDQDVHARSS
jgi:hypothetical protein